MAYSIIVGLQCTIEKFDYLLIGLNLSLRKFTGCQQQLIKMLVILMPMLHEKFFKLQERYKTS